MSDAVAAAMSELMDFAADAGIYTPNGGAAVAVQVRIDKQEFIEPDGYQVAVSGQEIRAKALLSELCREPIGKTQTTEGDIFTVLAGDMAGDYEVISVMAKDNYFVTCAVREI